MIAVDRAARQARLGRPMITHYCERTGPGLFGEPVNTITNVSFLIAAYLAWRLARRLNATTRGVVLLVVLAAAIGVGSAIYHATAAPWAMALDLLPIYLFQLVFLGLYLHRVAGWAGWPTVVSITVFLAACATMAAAPPILNRSLVYAPALIVLLALGVWHHSCRRPGSWDLAWAAGLFFAALFFRTIEPAVCGGIPTGTHFLWHLFNGAVVYLAMRVLILTEAAGKP